MRRLALVFTYIFSFASIAAPPLGLSGQYQTSNLYPSVIKTPNNLATNLGAGNTLVETGNKNILANPSFEHATVTTGWTNSAGTPTGDTVNEIDGLKALSIALSAQTLNLTQDSNLYASQFNGSVQGIASVRVKTSVQGVRLCARRAGATSSSLCATHSGSGNWELLKVPFILSTTSNGLSINTVSNVTGTVLVDDAFVGASDLISTQTLDTTCDTIACQEEFSATINAGGGITSQSVAWISSVSLTDTSLFTVNFSAGLFSVAPSCVVSIEGGTVDSDQVVKINNFPTTTSFTYRTSDSNAGVNFVKAGRAAMIICQRQGTDYTAALQAQKDFQKTKVAAYSTPYYGSDRIGEVIFSSNATAPSGFISALGSSIGQSGSGATFTGDSYYPLYAHLWSLAGLSTTAGDPYRISSAKGASALADWQANKTITIDYATNALFIRAKASGRNEGSYQSSAVPNITGATGVHATGAANQNQPGNPFYFGGTYTNMFSGVSGNNQSSGWIMDLSRQSSVYQSVTEARPNNVALFAYVRFQADNQIIVGQFNGLESCTDSYQCTDVFSAYVNASGTVLSENIDWINGNATLGATGYSSFTFKSGINTVGMSCVVTPVQNGYPATAQILSNSATGLTVYTFRTDTSHVAVFSDYTVTCQKQGADYIGKTAKAVASDQNVRSVGSVGVDIQSVYFGSGTNCASACTAGTCTICNQVGTKITSVSWVSSGIYRLNGIDGLKYNCNGTGYSNTAFWQSIAHDRTVSTSSYATMSTGPTSSASPTNSGYNSVTCIGIP